jgi:hypothetical protein
LYVIEPEYPSGVAKWDATLRDIRTECPFEVCEDFALIYVCGAQNLIYVVRCKILVRYLRAV